MTGRDTAITVWVQPECASEKTTPSVIADAMTAPLTQGRLFRGARTQLRIRLLRQPGIEIADKTAKLPLPDTAVQILLRTSLASPV